MPSFRTIGTTFRAQPVSTTAKPMRTPPREAAALSATQTPMPA
jgi:hypothetical protein